ncbi:MAG: enoyl-CoA hydratase/isomerase family protein [Chloroflexi bacterium]|nr:enoyl-CoA hydratase/isomerase family protein [Chloroflexota bacterium]
MRVSPPCLASPAPGGYTRTERQLTMIMESCAAQRRERTPAVELQHARYEVRGSTAILTLDRPERLNALSPLMSASIRRVAQELREAQDYSVRALIVTGEGRSFCSGGDVGTFGPGGGAQAWRPPHGDNDTYGVFQQLDIPVICAINGFAIGAGLGMAMSGDIAIASDQAKFALFQPKRGVMIDGGAAWFVPRRIGVQQTLHLGWTTRMIEADEALRLGLVLEVVPHAQLMDRAMELADTYAMAAPIAVALTKRAVYQGLNQSAAELLEYERWGVAKCFQTEDVQEGVKAFQEKREPVFRGR